MLGIFKVAGRIIKAVTPRIGKRIRNVGVALIGGAGVTGTATVSLEGDDPIIVKMRLVLAILTVIQGIVGTFMAGIGQGQAETEVDTTE